MMKAPIESENEESDDDQEGEDDDSDEVCILTRFRSARTTMGTTPKTNRTLIMSFDYYLNQFRMRPSYFCLKNCMASSRVTL